MKKTTLLIVLIITLVLGNVANVFADAISYDMDQADYYVYVATPDGGLNIRSGPGTEYNRVMEGRIPDGVRLYIEYVSGNWGFTSYNGTAGWVALKQTTTTPPAPPTSAPTVTPTPQNTATVEPAITETPQETVTPTATVEATEPAPEDAKDAMVSQIILAVILVLLVVVVAILIVIIINLKSKK